MILITVQEILNKLNMTEKAMEFLGSGGDKGNKRKTEGVKYPPLEKARLDEAMARIVVAANDDDKLIAMAEYSKVMKEVKEEKAASERLVEFHGYEIPSKEVKAIESLLKLVNENRRKMYLVARLKIWKRMPVDIAYFCENPLSMENFFKQLIKV